MDEPEYEHEESVTVDFTNCRQPDGTYLHNSLEGIKCPTCDSLLTEHSSAEVRECSRKWQQQREAQSK
jgi:hypothetical protein